EEQKQSAAGSDAGGVFDCVVYGNSSVTSRPVANSVITTRSPLRSRIMLVEVVRQPANTTGFAPTPEKNWSRPGPGAGKFRSNSSVRNPADVSSLTRGITSTAALRP